jgi:hypothetical protein
MVRLSPSGSLSFVKTSIWLFIESSVTVLESSFATGGSFIPPTVTYIVALSVPPLLSVIE